MGPCGWVVFYVNNVYKDNRIACGPVRRVGEAHYFAVATTRVIARLSNTQWEYVQWYVNAHSIPVLVLPRFSLVFFFGFSSAFSL